SISFVSIGSIAIGSPSLLYPMAVYTVNFTPSPPLPTARRQGAESSRHGALQTDTAAAGPGENAGVGTTPYYPAWVIRWLARNLFPKQLLSLLFRPFPVNSR